MTMGTQPHLMAVAQCVKLRLDGLALVYQVIVILFVEMDESLGQKHVMMVLLDWSAVIPTVLVLTLDGFVLEAILLQELIVFLNVGMENELDQKLVTMETLRMMTNAMQVVLEMWLDGIVKGGVQHQLQSVIQYAGMDERLDLSSVMMGILLMPISVIHFVQEMS